MWEFWDSLRIKRREGEIIRKQMNRSMLRSIWMTAKMEKMAEMRGKKKREKELIECRILLKAIGLLKSTWKMKMQKTVV